MILVQVYETGKISGQKHYLRCDTEDIEFYIIDILIYGFPGFLLSLLYHFFHSP